MAGSAGSADSGCQPRTDKAWVVSAIDGQFYTIAYGAASPALLRPASPQKTLAQAARLWAQSATSSSRTYSTGEWSPEPPGPNRTPGMPAALSSAASVQKLWPPNFTLGPAICRAQS